MRRFVVSFEADERTRWLFGSEETIKALADAAEMVGRAHTQGTVPVVRVEELDLEEKATSTHE